jgi:uncharacterized protein (DUF1697 family)
MATRLIALLRGINVGKAKRIAMAELRALFADLGFTEIATLLNSGNVVFTAGKVSDAAARIERAIEKELGLASRVTVIDAAELDEIVRENPLLDIAREHARLIVTVLSDPLDRAKLIPLTRSDWGDERIALGRRAAYLWCPAGSLESKSNAAVGKLLGTANTSRNWATILKLQAIVASAPAKIK